MNVVNRSVTIKDKDDDEFTIFVDKDGMEIQNISGSVVMRFTRYGTRIFVAEILELDSRFRQSLGDPDEDQIAEDNA